MIPEKIMIRIGCDACDAGVTVTLDEDAIDDTGWDLALEGQLIDSGWGVSDRMTFCPRCMERAQTMALRQLAREAEHKEAAHVSI